MAGLDADFYDEAFSDPKWEQPAEGLGWAVLWRNVARSIADGSHVIDVGCGPGKLHEFLWDRDIPKITATDDRSSHDVALTRIDGSTPGSPVWSRGL